MARRGLSVLQRFAKFITIPADPTQCWEWTGTRKNKNQGYGSFWFRKKHDRAHRVSHVLFNGEIALGLVVRHTCDNDKCVNPQHLILGTQLDNMRDKKVRDRSRPRKPSGENGARSAILTEGAPVEEKTWYDD